MVGGILEVSVALVAFVADAWLQFVPGLYSGSDFVCDFVLLKRSLEPA